jgi:hypothetical protein
VWDIDAAGNVVVPMNVKLATMHQAESLLVGNRSERLQAIADGLASQGVGTLQESYFQGAEPAAIVEPAMRLLARYRLRTGELL